MAIAVETVVTGNGSGATSVATSTGITTAGPSVLVAAITALASGSYTSAVSSVTGGTDITTAWQKVAGGSAGVFDSDAEIWIAITGSGQSSQTITANWANSQAQLSIAVYSLTGCDTSSVEALVDATLDGTAQSTNMSRDITVVSDGSMVIAAVVNPGEFGTTPSATSGSEWGYLVPSALNRGSLRSSSTRSAGTFTIGTTGWTTGTLWSCVASFAPPASFGRSPEVDDVAFADAVEVQKYGPPETEFQGTGFQEDAFLVLSGTAADTGARSGYVTDTLGLRDTADGAQGQPGRSSGPDTVALSDSAVGAQRQPGAMSGPDTAAFSDGVGGAQRQAGASSGPDTVALSDSADGAQGQIGAASGPDTVALADAAVGAQRHPGAPPSDTFALSDASSGAQGQVGDAGADTVAFADAADTALGAAGTNTGYVLDTLGLSDAAVANMAAAASAAEGAVALADAVEFSWASADRYGSITDSFAFADAVACAMAAPTTSETVAFADAVAFAVPPPVNDSVGFADAVHARCSELHLPGPKPVRYWRDADLDALRSAVIELWSAVFGSVLILPGPKPVRYWTGDEFNQIRDAIMSLWFATFGSPNAVAFVDAISGFLA